jgi:hypothetical protein
VLLAALHDLGLSASRAAAELIHEPDRWVSAQAGISPTAARHYLNHPVHQRETRITNHRTPQKSPWNKQL